MHACKRVFSTCSIHNTDLLNIERVWGTTLELEKNPKTWGSGKKTKYFPRKNASEKRKNCFSSVVITEWVRTPEGATPVGKCRKEVEAKCHSDNVDSVYVQLGPLPSFQRWRGKKGGSSTLRTPGQQQKPREPFCFLLQSFCNQSQRGRGAGSHFAD